MNPEFEPDPLADPVTRPHDKWIKRMSEWGEKAQGARASNLHALVEAATVSLPGKVARGVLVEGGFIFTAAHCIGDHHTGESLALVDDNFVTVIKGNIEFFAQILHADLASDFAILGPFDGDKKFADFIRSTAGLALASEAQPAGHEFRCELFCASGWLPGHGRSLGPAPSRFELTTVAEIAPGDSGSPIIGLDGRLIGLTSICTLGDSPTTEVEGPFFPGAMPTWIFK